LKVEDVSDAPKLVRELDRQRLGAAILWKFIERNCEPQKMPTLKTLVPKICAEYLFEDENQTRQYIFYQSEHLLKYMQERRRQKVWRNSRLFKELLECQLSPELRAEMGRITVRTRDYALNIASVEYHTSSDEELPNHHQTMSSLRPKGGKGSGKKSKSYRGRETLSREQDGALLIEDQRSSAVSTPVKRKYSESHDDDEPDARRKLFILSIDGEITSQRASSAELGEDEAVTETLTLRWKRDSLGEDASIITDGVPLQLEANAPGDIWRCPVLGCVHVVYGASGKLGKRLIEEHFEEHKGDDDAPQVNLAVREMQKCKLPVRYVSI
jgi:hypothetical protein